MALYLKLSSPVVVHFTLKTVYTCIIVSHFIFINL